jgi:hypothetical protein
MRHPFFLCLALCGAYLLGSFHDRAQAADPKDERTAMLLQQLVSIQREQVEALKTLARNDQASRAQQEQAEALKTIARSVEGDLTRAAQDHTNALRELVRTTERCTGH